jgi:kumamolisin
MSYRPTALLGLALLATASAFAFPDPNIHIPDTSVANPADAGLRAHTNHLVYAGPRQEIDPVFAMFAPTHGPALAASGPSGLHPDQIRAAYGAASTGGSGAIAVVLAYHYATALNDFNVFSTQFGLPTQGGGNATNSANVVFQVVYAGGVQPKANGGWGQEAAMDIEWTHSMAPGAKIYLVEANSNSFADLFAAVDVAKGLPGVKCVSMSWGSNEFSSETGYDSHFSGGGVFFASGGDSGGVKSYPAVSPYVIGVGGTHLVVGTTVTETAWTGSGCGVSSYENAPGYQSFLGLNKRSADDISSNADPYTGCSVYDSTRYQGYVGWMVFGGTSLSSPTQAGLFNLAGAPSGDSVTELGRLYSHRNTSGLFRDITSGSAGGLSAGTGYDNPTGIGATISASAW